MGWGALMLLAEFLDLYGMINSSLNGILVQLWAFIRDLMDHKTYFLLSVGIGRPDSTLQRVCTHGSSVICSSIIKDMWWSDVTFLSVILSVIFCWHSYEFAEENAKRGFVFILKNWRLRSLFEPQELVHTLWQWHLWWYGKGKAWSLRSLKTGFYLFNACPYALSFVQNRIELKKQSWILNSWHQ